MFKIYFSITLCVVLASFATVLAVKMFTRSVLEQNWPQADAHLLSVNIETQRVQGAETNAQYKGFVWVLSASYEYKYEGVSYSSNRIFNTEPDMTLFEKDASKLSGSPPDAILSFKDYLENSEKFKVYVNPNKPSYSFIEYKKGFGRLAAVVGFALMFWVSAIGIYFSK